MTNESKQIIEINGVKMEIDLRQARRVDHFRVGDPVKIMITEHNSSTVKPGVIVGFENFTDLPTIVVAYINIDYSGGGLNFAFINAKNKDKYDIVASDEDTLLAISKSEVLHYFDKQIVKLETEAKEHHAKRQMFLDRSGSYFPNRNTETEETI